MDKFEADFSFSRNYLIIIFLYKKLIFYIHLRNVRYTKLIMRVNYSSKKITFVPLEMVAVNEIKYTYMYDNNM